MRHSLIRTAEPAEANVHDVSLHRSPAVCIDCRLRSLGADINPGRKQLAITHARYQTVTRPLALVTGKPQTLDVMLQRPTHELMVETVPLGATISIAGHRAGTSPTTV